MSEKKEFKKKELNLKAIEISLRKYWGFSEKELEELVKNPKRFRKKGSYISR